MQQTYYFETTSAKPRIVDAGSNIGLSILYFKFLYPDCEVVGFEPDQETFRLLKKNIFENSVSKVVLHQLALSDKDCELDFYRKNQTIASPQMGAFNQDRSGFQSIAKVSCVRLSPYIDESVDYLKMDVEGAEFSVLKELSDSHQLKKIHQMGFEYHHNRKTTGDLSEILPGLLKNNFVFRLSSDEKGPRPAWEPQDLMVYAEQRPPC